MLPSKAFSFPGIDREVQQLGRMLRLGLQSTAWSCPDAPAVLNLACGRADETGVLLSELAPHAKRLFYLGIDLRAPEIAEARARWLPAAPLGWDLDFRAGDASRTDRMKLLPPMDFIFIRHQNFWHDIPTWTRLYRNALALLKPGGTLAITSYFDREHALAGACLTQLGARQIAQLPNPSSRVLNDAPGKSVDRHLAFYAPAQE